MKKIDKIEYVILCIHFQQQILHVQTSYSQVGGWYTVQAPVFYLFNPEPIWDRTTFVIDSERQRPSFQPRINPNHIPPPFPRTELRGADPHSSGPFQEPAYTQTLHVTLLLSFLWLLFWVFFQCTELKAIFGRWICPPTHPIHTHTHTHQSKNKKMFFLYSLYIAHFSYILSTTTLWYDINPATLVIYYIYSSLRTLHFVDFFRLK
jgi:hypothetical protein